MSDDPTLNIDQPQAELGNYVLLEKLGEGGMGAVFKAKHKVMDRVVAIKMLSAAGLKDQKSVERFQREVRAAAKLQHPNIVAAYDADQAGGQAFLVMEYVKGIDLAQLVKQRGTVAVDRALDYVMQAARGLEHAHQAGIVHRDIKPANLVLDEKGVVKILDMGLARLDQDEEQQNLTNTGQVVGTVTYMSPEQAMSTKHVDARTDIYSLGCTLHYLLTGTAPFKGDTAMQTLMAHRMEPIPDLRAKLPAVSPQLQMVYERMLAKQPNERYASMTECLAALESLLGVRQQVLQETVARGADQTSTGSDEALASFLSSNSQPFTATPTQQEETRTSQYDLTSSRVAIQPTTNHSGPRHPPWFQTPVGLASLGGGAALVLLLLTVVFMLRTPSGMLVVEIDEPGTTVSVDGEQKVLIQRPGGQQAVQVEVDQQQHELKVTKDGFEVFTSQFSMKGKDEQSIRVRLTPLGKPPVVSTPETLSLTAGQRWTYPISASDPNTPAGELRYELAPGGPNGAQVDAISGVLSWTPPPNLSGLHAIKVRVSSSRAPSTPQFATFTVRVNPTGSSSPTTPSIPSPTVRQPVQLTSLPQQRVEAGQQLRVQLQARDPNPSPLPLRYELGSGAPGGLTLDARTGELSWQVPSSQPPGLQTITFRVLGGDGNTPSATGSLSVLIVSRTTPFPTVPAGPFAGKTAGEERSDNGLGMKFCWCPPGKFTMGSPTTEKERYPDREAQVEVTLTQGFWLGKYEVTQGEYEKVMGKNPSAHRTVAGQDTSRFPVDNVCWTEASEYCQKLTKQERAAGRLPVGWEYRLPSEAQWEYACRSGTTTATAFGDSLSSKQANFDGSGPYNGAARGPYLGRTTTVGSYAANAWGLHDMHGNVWEWCQDWYGDKLPGGTDPIGATSGSLRVNRSGSWNISGRYCRSAIRNESAPDDRYYLGLRVALVLSSPPATIPPSTAPLQVGQKAGDEWSGNTLGMKFCWCPPGKFTMSSPNTEKDREPDENQVEVTLTKGFWLGKYEVTQGEYETVMGKNPSWYSASGGGRSKVVGQDTARFPVEMVTWMEATEYCQKLTERERIAGQLPVGWEYRLPTEAQWEYACRAGTTTATAFGDQLSSKQANFRGGYPYNGAEKGPDLGRPTLVGSYAANAWGLRDMHGNVYEWCQDWHGDKLLGGTDPVGVSTGSNRVLRGGVWSDHGRLCRSANRLKNEPGYLYDGQGFRVALVPSGPAHPTIPPPNSSNSPLQIGSKAGEEWSDNTLGMKFCWCPPGKFTMGSPTTEKDRDSSREAQVEVTLTQGFWLGKYEVTQGEYEQLMRKNPSSFSATGSSKSKVADQDTSRFPVEYVSWLDATEYCRKLTEQERAAGRLPAGWEYRLPSEAQWEYACRAGTRTATAFGDSLSSKQANFRGSPYNGAESGPSLGRPTTVGSYAANAWGLHDLHGNVYEWCQDWYSDQLPGGMDPLGVTTGSHRVSRGGGWSSSGGQYCRSAIRGGDPPDNRNSWLGFRVSLVPSGPLPTIPPSTAPLQIGQKAGEEWSGNTLGMKFCWCPPGKFSMGSPETERNRDFRCEAQVEVTLTQGFWLGKYEVTQGEYEKVMGKNPSYFSATGSGKTKVADQETSQFPVEIVTWTDASEFCKKLTEQERTAGRLPAGWEYRLPTEAQWEYACRAGTTTATAFGNSLSSNQANINEPYNGAEKGPNIGRTTKVGSYAANAWGLHDMHGNVWEWCQDWSMNKLPGGTDPLGATSGTYRVKRGGGWDFNPHGCRSAVRGGGTPGVCNSFLGFRVALVPTGPLPAIPPSTAPLQVGQKAGDEWSGNTLGMKFCWCPPGKFTMGSPKTEKNRRLNEDQVEVTLTQGFWLGKYEVMQGEYEKLMGKNPSSFSATSGGKTKVAGQDTSRFPVEYVSWKDATEYCRKLTEQERAAGRLPGGWEYRLPTEAQWEYACRAGTTAATAFGDSLSSKQANFDGDSPYNRAERGPDLDRTTTVGSYVANSWGLHDMHGNLWEWCQDWFMDKLSGGTDPLGATSGSNLVVRGGSWDHDGLFCRSASRSDRQADYCYLNVGFRIALVPTGNPPTIPPSTAPLQVGQQAGDEWLGNSLGMKFCWCPPGKFMMGSPATEKDRDDDEDQVSVTLTQGFWLGKYEVTQGEWERVMGMKPWSGKEYVKEGDSFPASYVSWDDVVEYCKKLTAQERQGGRLPSGWEYRLPTEAQWEYGCRAGTTTAYVFGDDPSRLGEYAWYDKNAYYVDEKYAHEAGQKRPNAWGLHDLHGNVREWCLDWYSEKLAGGADPVGATTGSYRVIRGGCWRGIGQGCRSASCLRDTPVNRRYYLGFRVALVPPVQQ